VTGLGFYRPEFLWGLLFLAAVLLIHLLRRPNTQTIDFSTLRFFRESAVRASRMRRLRKILLLITRCAAAAMLAVLFAQPFNRHSRLESLLHNPNLTLFVWADQTPSMGYATKNGSLLSQACALTDSLRKMLPPTARCFWYDEGGTGFVPCDPSKPLAMRTRHGPCGLEKVLRAWKENSSGCSLPLLVLLSDCQKSASGSLDSLFKNTNGPVVCVVLTPDAPWNCSLRNARFPRFREAGNAFGVSVTALTQGKKLDSGEIAVTMSGISAGRKRVSALADDTATVAIEVAGALNTVGGSVTLKSGVNPDPLPFDNTVFFTSGSSSAQRVIIVGDRERNFPVFSAFSAFGENRWNPVILKNSDEVSFDELDTADVVVINGLGRLSRPLEAFFSSRSSGKKTVLYACDADDGEFGSSAAFMSRILLKINPLRRQKLMNYVTAGKPAAIVLPDTLSEIWRGFPSLHSTETAIYRYAEGLPGTPLLRLDNGTPLATLFQEDDNRSWIFVATPLGISEANNFVETGFYVPFIDRIVSYASDKNPSKTDFWIAGFERRNPMFGSGKGAAIYNEEGKLLEQWQSQTNVLFRQPGLYKIVPEGEPANWIAVNPDTGESRLRYKLPVVPDELNSNVLIINKKQILFALKGKGGFPSYLPWFFLVLLLLAEVSLWEKRSKTSEKNPAS
jgi:hypothetical protein